MKLPIFLTLALAAPAIAGTEVYTRNEVAPAPQMSEPAVWNWFAGASAGYLNDFEEDMFHVHVGMDTPWQVAGWNVALFAEVGWTETDASSPAVGIGSTVGRDTQEFEIIPMTFNVKLERPITDRFSVYMGAGAGVALVDYHLNRAFESEVNANDEVLAAQVFAGVVFNATAHLEVFAGARWIYVDYDTPQVVGISAPEFGDDILGEVGLRYNF